MGSRVLKLTGAALALALVIALPSAAAHSKCRPGSHKQGGVQVITFCGPASVTVKVAGMSVHMKGGNCQKTKNWLAINIGSVTTYAPPGAKKPNYFGLTVGKTPVGGSPAGHDGTYHNDAYASLEYKNQLYSIALGSPSTVKLSGGRSKGTFSGQLSGGGGTMSGSFSCS